MYVRDPIVMKKESFVSHEIQICRARGAMWAFNASLQYVPTHNYNWATCGAAAPSDRSEAGSASLEDRTNWVK